MSLNTEIKWGLIFSGVALMWLILEFFVGLHDKYISLHPYLSNLSLIPAVAIMYLAIRDKRKTLGGEITFKQAFLCGLLVSVVVALLAPLSQFIFHRLINPNFFSNAIKHSVETGKLTLEQAGQLFSLPSYMFQESVGGIIIGTVISLILAPLMRTRTPAV